MANEQQYTPINCEIHDGYELACMRKAIHNVEWIEQGITHSEKLRFLDLEYSKKGEFLIAENEQKELRKIRLDSISSQLPY
jgi:Rho-binding antiterminator